MNTAHETVQHAETSSTDDVPTCMPSQKVGTQNEQLPLPVAQRNNELSDRDFEVLLRVAEDPQAQAGRLRHTPKKVPLRKRSTRT